MEYHVKKVHDLLEESMYILYNMEVAKGKLPDTLDKAWKDIDTAHKKLCAYLKNAFRKDCGACG